MASAGHGHELSLAVLLLPVLLGLWHTTAVCQRARFRA